MLQILRMLDITVLGVCVGGSRDCDLWAQKVISICLALCQILDSHVGGWEV
jgi:hypothetical protein